MILITYGLQIENIKNQHVGVHKQIHNAKKKNFKKIKIATVFLPHFCKHTALKNL
jgi:hypothetical protein